MNRQKLTSNLHDCFLANPQIRSLQLEQTANYRFFSATHREVVAVVD